MTIRELTSSDNFFLLAGPCVIEGEDMAMRIAERIVAMTTERNIPYVFKGSYRIVRVLTRLQVSVMRMLLGYCVECARLLTYLL